MTDPTRPPLPSEAEISDLVQAGRRGDAVELFMVKGADIPAEMLAPMKGSPMWEGMEALAHTLAYEAAIMDGGAVPEQRLAAVTTPTLVLVGAESPARMQDAAQAVAGALPDAQLHTLEGQAHGQVDPAGLGAELSAFFAA